MDGNPNMIDSLFVDDDKIIFIDEIGRLVRTNRKIFLSQKCFHTFRGMAHSHISRLKNRERIGNRSLLIQKYGYDVKDASHIVRLIFELKQIMTEGDLNLTRNKEIVFGVKNGEWSKQEVVSFFEEQMIVLENINKDNKSVVRYSPDEKKIKKLLIDCLEISYGSLSNIGFKK